MSDDNSEEAWIETFARLEKFNGDRYRGFPPLYDPNMFKPEETQGTPIRGYSFDNIILDEVVPEPEQKLVWHYITIPEEDDA